MLQWFMYHVLHILPHMYFVIANINAEISIFAKQSGDMHVDFLIMWMICMYNFYSFSQPDMIPYRQNR